MINNFPICLKFDDISLLVIKKSKYRTVAFATTKKKQKLICLQSALDALGCGLYALCVSEQMCKTLENSIF